MATSRNAIPGATVAEGRRTPVDRGVMERLVQGVRYIITGTNPTEWFGPGQPVLPVAQEAARGRQLDFPVAINVRRTVRDAIDGISFDQMRALADGYDLLRLVIETRKDQVEKMRWSIGPKTKRVKPDARCIELEKFFAYPDQEHDWNTWLRALLEDMFVVDAATLYPRPRLNGDLYALELVDGATIKRLVDATGRTPIAPDPAYQQILKGMAAVDYTFDELIYKPRNVRTHRIYGYSPVEQIIMTVNIAMRRQLHQLQYYTEGNIPEALAGVPEDWNPDQIAQFQTYWDSLHEGNTAQRRHMKFVPGGQSFTPTKEPDLKGEYDEWLARIVCYAFSVSPLTLSRMMNRATAETSQEQAIAEGLQPVLNWVRNLITFIIGKYFGAPDLEFKWVEQDASSPLEKMQVLTGYVKAGVIEDDEARDDLGRDPYTPEQRERLKPPVPPPVSVGDQAQAQGAEGADGGTGKPVGKRHSLSLAKAIDRDRPGVTEATAALRRTVADALSAAATRIAKQITDKTHKTFDTSAQVAGLLRHLSLDELEAVEPAIADLLRQVYDDGGQAGLEQVLSTFTGAQLEQVHTRAVEYAATRSAALIRGLTDSTRDMIRGTLTESLEGGWSATQLADALVNDYGFSDTRAETIARTETAYADVQGSLAGFKASGVVRAKRWIIAQDEYCDDCAELDGTEVPLDDDFPNDGGDGPPLHPNCRCDVVPVLTEEPQ